MIGLAVGIDYSLFIVQRFREERASARQSDAIATAAHRKPNVFFPAWRWRSRSPAC